MLPCLFGQFRSVLKLFCIFLEEEKRKKKICLYYVLDLSASPPVTTQKFPSFRVDVGGKFASSPSTTDWIGTMTEKHKMQQGCVGSEPLPVIDEGKFVCGEEKEKSNYGHVSNFN